LAPKIRIRPQVLGDTDKVWDLLTAAFRDTGRVAALAEALLEGPSRVALVAEDRDGDEIVGHVQLSHSWLDARKALVDVLVLSPLGVAPHRQRQGIGAALVTAALAAGEEREAPLIWLEGEPTYYPEFGFTRAGERGFRPPSDRIPAEAFLVATLQSWQPWMTGGLVYPDEFWAHDSVGPRRT
jgi:putative acetyltransferase